MGNSVTFDMNTDAVLKNLDKLDPHNLYRGIRAAICKGAEVLVRQTEANMRASNLPVDRPNARYGFTMTDGIYGIWDKSDPQGLTMKVGIDANYLNRWFENGTWKSQPRKTKSGASRGVIKPYHFFARAKNASAGGMDTAVTNELDKQIEQQLSR